MARNTFPKDIAPMTGGTMVLSEVLPDGSRGISRRTFKDLMTSATFSTSTTSEEVPTGKGPDITIATSEQDTVTIEVSGFNLAFHSLVTGRSYEQGVGLAPVMSEITIVAGTYTFPDGVEAPTADALGNTRITLADKYGNVLVDESEAIEAVTDNGYKWDGDTKTLTVDVGYNEEVLDIFFFTSKDRELIKSNDVIEAKEFELELYAETQSLRSKTHQLRYVRIARAVVDGDRAGLNAQKSPNSPVSYTFVSQTPPSGDTSFTEMFTDL